MYKKYLISFLLIIATFIIHQSLVLNLNWQFNFWPAILIFILFIFKEKTALVWGISIGYLLDHFSYIPFGVNLVILFLMISVVYFLIKNILTNRSVLSLLILTLVGTLIYDGLYLVVSGWLIKEVELESIIRLNLSGILLQIFANLILVFVLFLIVIKFTKRLQSDLITKRYGG